MNRQTKRPPAEVCLDLRENERKAKRTGPSEGMANYRPTLPPPSPVEGVFCRSAERVARRSVHVLKVPERDEFSETLNRISGQVKESSGQPD